MKRRLALYLLLLAAAACGKKPSAGGPVPQSMNESVAQFLVAVKANNQKRMGELWGTERGPAASSMNSDVLRQRLAVIQKYLDHTGYRIIEGPMAVAGRDDLRTYRVELQRANCNQVIPIDVIRTHSGGWLVYDVHLEAAGSPVGRCQPAAPAPAATPPAPPPPPGGTRPQEAAFHQRYSVNSSRMPFVDLG